MNGSGCAPEMDIVSQRNAHNYVDKENERHFLTVTLVGGIEKKKTNSHRELVLRQHYWKTIRLPVEEDNHRENKESAVFQGRELVQGRTAA